MAQAVELLRDFVSASKAKGASDEFLAALLMRRGWSADDAYRALGQYWEQATGLAVPERGFAREAARDAFLYLLSFATLSTWAAALGSMLFLFIDYWLPDPVAPVNPWMRAAVTWQMASVVVAFPIYVLVMRTILGEVAVNPERLESGVRKWLTYIALLITAGAMICDLIFFLDRFLAGGLSARFMLKSAVVMAICGAIFAYYLRSLRWGAPTDFAREQKRGFLFGSASAAVLAICFSIGLGLAGTPARQRLIEADYTRVQNLRQIAETLYSWRQRTDGATLPVALTELRATNISVPRLTDPETGAPYEYRVTGGTRYELCATFAAAASSEPDRHYVDPFWTHGPGRACFALDASRITQ